jgi:hypothetical protein
MPHTSYPIFEVQQSSQLGPIADIAFMASCSQWPREQQLEQSMTAFLISLALAGLVAIVIWEGVS